MAREWSERHIRDLVHSEWKKLGGGGSINEIIDDIMNEFEAALRGVAFTANTMDVKQNSFYEYHDVRLHAEIVGDSVHIDKNTLEGNHAYPVYDIYFDYSGYVSLSDNDQGEITQNKRIGAISKYVGVDVDIIDSTSTHYLEIIIGLVSYYWYTITEHVRPETNIFEDIKLIFGYGNEPANKPDIIIKETGEELSLEDPMAMDMYKGAGLYIIRTMTDFNTDNYLSRTFGGSRHIRVVYNTDTMGVYVDVDETTMDYPQE